MTQSASATTSMSCSTTTTEFPASTSRWSCAALSVVPGPGLFSHEERPAEVAVALLPVLTGSR